MTVTQEIDLIAKNATDDIFYPEDVVAYARTHPDSALAACLEWNDTKGGEEYRKLQAAKLIEGIGGIASKYVQFPN